MTRNSTAFTAWKQFGGKMENAVVKFINDWEFWQREGKCEQLGRIQYLIIEKKSNQQKSMIML